MRSVPHIYNAGCFNNGVHYQCQHTTTHLKSQRGSCICTLYVTKYTYFQCLVLEQYKVISSQVPILWHSLLFLFVYLFLFPRISSMCCFILRKYVRKCKYIHLKNTTSTFIVKPLCIYLPELEYHKNKKTQHKFTEIRNACLVFFCILIRHAHSFNFFLRSNIN